MNATNYFPIVDATTELNTFYASEFKQSLAQSFNVAQSLAFCAIYFSKLGICKAKMHFHVTIVNADRLR